MLKFWEPRSHLPCGNFQSWKKLPEITPGIHAWNFSESLEQFSWMEKQKEKGISCICGIFFPFINWLLRTFLPHPRNNIATKGPFCLSVHLRSWLKCQVVDLLGLPHARFLLTRQYVQSHLGRVLLWFTPLEDPGPPLHFPQICASLVGTIQIWR